MTNQHAGAIEALYDEAMRLGDQARGWFDGAGMAWRNALPVDAQARVAVESLAITARLMAVMSWLLDPIHAGGNTVRPFPAFHDVPMPDASPLAGTVGGDIARLSRELLAKAVALGSFTSTDSGVWR